MCVWVILVKCLKVDQEMVYSCYLHLNCLEFLFSFHQFALLESLGAAPLLCLNLVGEIVYSFKSLHLNSVRLEYLWSLYLFPLMC